VPTPPAHPHDNFLALRPRLQPCVERDIGEGPGMIDAVEQAAAAFRMPLHQAQHAIAIALMRQER